MKQLARGLIGWGTSVVALCGCNGSLEVAGTGGGSGGETRQGGGVEFAGGETTDFGSGAQPVCSYGSAEPVPEGDVDRFGFTVDELSAIVDGTHSYPAAWYDSDDPFDDSRRTGLELSMEIDSFHRLPLVREAEGATCDTERLQVRVLVNVAEENGELQGAFYARLVPSREDGEVSLNGRAAPDLRNFQGSLLVPLDVDCPHFSILEAELALGALNQGEMVIRAEGNDPACSSGPFTVASWGGFRQASTRLVTPEGEPSIRLDDYEGSSEPPTQELQVCVQGEEHGQAVALVVSIDGTQMTDNELAVWDCVDLGGVPRDAQIEAVVTNSDEDVLIGTSIATDCNVSVGEASCEAAGCDATAEYTVRYAECVN